MLCTEILERTSSVLSLSLCVFVCVQHYIAFCCITTKKCIDRGASGRHHRRRRSLSLSLSPSFSLLLFHFVLSLLHPILGRWEHLTFPLVFLLLFNAIREIHLTKEPYAASAPITTDLCFRCVKYMSPLSSE